MNREVEGPTDGPLVITAAYVRPLWFLATRELHLDPIIRCDFVVYGLSAGQVGTASTVSLPHSQFIKLSKGIPRGSIFIPIRYSKEAQAYMAPAISRVVLTLGGLDLPDDVYRDMNMWDLEPELIDALKREAGLEECVNALRDKYGLNGEGVRRAREILLRAGITEEPTRSLLLKALEEDAIREHHLQRVTGLVVIAETLVCFTEDAGLESIRAPTIDLEMAAYLLDRERLNLKQYAGSFRPIRGFVGEKARRLLRHLIEQRIPWI